MPIALTVSEEATHAVVDGELTIFTAAELKDELFALLNHPQVCLDLGQVGELDGCAAQMLAILLKEAGQAGRPMRIVHSNALVDEALRWLGVAVPADGDRESGEDGHGSEQG